MVFSEVLLTKITLMRRFYFIRAAQSKFAMVTAMQWGPHARKQFHSTKPKAKRVTVRIMPFALQTDLAVCTLQGWFVLKCPPLCRRVARQGFQRIYHRYEIPFLRPDSRQKIGTEQKIWKFLLSVQKIE